MQVTIKKAIYKSDYKIEIEFSDGKVHVVDFGPFLKSAKHPEIQKYLELEEFKQFQVVDGDLDWKDFDLTFPIWDLYTGKISKDGEEDQEAS